MVKVLRAGEGRLLSVLGVGNRGGVIVKVLRAGEWRKRSEIGVIGRSTGGGGN